MYDTCNIQTRDKNKKTQSEKMKIRAKYVVKRY